MVSSKKVKCVKFKHAEEWDKCKVVTVLHLYSIHISLKQSQHLIKEGSLLLNSVLDHLCCVGWIFHLFLSCREHEHEKSHRAQYWLVSWVHSIYMVLVEEKSPFRLQPRSTRKGSYLAGQGGITTKSSWEPYSVAREKMSKTEKVRYFWKPRELEDPSQKKKKSCIE